MHIIHVQNSWSKSLCVDITRCYMVALLAYLIRTFISNVWLGFCFAHPFVKETLCVLDIIYQESHYVGKLDNTLPSLSIKGGLSLVKARGIETLLGAISCIRVHDIFLSSGPSRRPPQSVIDQLKTTNKSVRLGQRLCRSRSPDFLLEIIQRQVSLKGAGLAQRPGFDSGLDAFRKVESEPKSFVRTCQSHI